MSIKQINIKAHSYMKKEYINLFQGIGYLHLKITKKKKYRVISKNNYVSFAVCHT